MSVWGTTADENELGCHRRGRTWSSALMEPKSPRMSLALDALRPTDCRLLSGEAHAREFASVSSLRHTGEGDSRGSVISAVLRIGCRESSITACFLLAQAGEP